ncbi:hypothetical protein BaRGS_00015330 [Batillaria attramentaria]|uniref:Uncharacterized protein n=1 Tax=Batillaria attramentaria TaxID=370345 RepID=A0ABD0L1T5_9CAEN
MDASRSLDVLSLCLCKAACARNFPFHPSRGGLTTQVFGRFLLQSFGGIQISVHHQDVTKTGTPAKRIQPPCTENTVSILSPVLSQMNPATPSGREGIDSPVATVSLRHTNTLRALDS